MKQNFIIALIGVGLGKMKKKPNPTPINVLSLFDGMSCGQIALDKLGVSVENYFASEIEKQPIMVTQANYPHTRQLGSVVDVKASLLPKIDLVHGGSPCQDLSYGKPSGKGLEGSKSMLFWEFVRIVKEVLAINPEAKFLLENVKMKQEWEDIITKELGVEPIEINSNLLSAQNRKRLYWTNIEGVTQPEDKGILIQDIIYDDTYKVFTDERITNTKVLTKNYVKWDLSGKRYWSQQDRAYYRDGKLCCLPKANPSNKVNICLDIENDVYRRLHPVEAERAQTVPDGYTDVDGVTSNKRLEMLGNGWTVDVIAHIYSFLFGSYNN
jgi:site-specific DNA-cytosine methylase